MISQVRNMGYNVNGDNMPAQENMSIVFTNITPTPYRWWMYIQGLEQLLFLFEAMWGEQSQIPKVYVKKPNDKPHKFLAWFMYLWPMEYIKETLMPATNAAIKERQWHLVNCLNTLGYGYLWKMSSQVTTWDLGLMIILNQLCERVSPSGCANTQLATALRKLLLIWGSIWENLQLGVTYFIRLWI